MGVVVLSECSYAGGRQWVLPVSQQKHNNNLPEEVKMTKNTSGFEQFIMQPYLSVMLLDYMVLNVA